VGVENAGFPLSKPVAVNTGLLNCAACDKAQFNYNMCTHILRSTFMDCELSVIVKVAGRDDHLKSGSL